MCNLQCLEILENQKHLNLRKARITKQGKTKARKTKKVKIRRRIEKVKAKNSKTKRKIKAKN